MPPSRITSGSLSISGTSGTAARHREVAKVNKDLIYYVHFCDSLEQWEQRGTLDNADVTFGREGAYRSRWVDAALRRASTAAGLRTLSPKYWSWIRGGSPRPEAVPRNPFALIAVPRRQTVLPRRSANDGDRSCPSSAMFRRVVPLLTSGKALVPWHTGPVGLHAGARRDRKQQRDRSLRHPQVGECHQPVKNRQSELSLQRF
jgi:hypothetical protein